MLSRRSVLLLVFLLSSLAIGFFGVSIDCAAALSGGRYMTPSEALDVFGSEIQFTYYDGADYTSASFLYNSTVSIGTTSGALPANWSDYTAATYLEYIATVQSPVPVANPNYITVNISPTYSIFDTDQITSLIALSSVSSSVSTVYQSPSWDWIVDGSQYHYENTLDDGNGLYSSISFHQHFYSTFVPMQFIGSSSTSGYSYRAQFSGNVVGGSNVAGAYRYKYYLHIMCPYISADASGSFGTVTTSSGSSGSDINVNIDMSQTNGLLEDIKQGLAGIWSGITSVFIPSQSFVEDWKDDMSDLLDDTFGRYSEVDELLDDVKDSIVGASPSSTIQLPAVSVPNTSLQFSSRTVDVVPSGSSWEIILDTIKFLFDILFTTLFINTVRQRIRTIVHGETMVEVEGVD